VKNQYFGDINDYLKYALLRALSGHGELRTLVAWMLTRDDGGPDGRKLGYLQQPERYRHLDPEVFDFLVTAAADEHRGVELLAASGLLPNSRFHTELLADGSTPRQQYFATLTRYYSAADWIFFDPDNGLEIPSCPPGRRGSSKFVRWGEVAEAHRSRLSVLLYQHFPREARDRFIARTSERLRQEAGAAEVIVLTTANVGFFLLPQDEHLTMLKQRAVALVRAANGLLRVWDPDATVLTNRVANHDPIAALTPEGEASGHVISEVLGLTAREVGGRRVLCPSCREHTFKRWPWGWDSHAHRCAGLDGDDPEVRKTAFRTRWRALFT
jgi:hypothetical protein